MSDGDVLAHWNSRASLGGRAGTQDLGLVRLERQVIASHVQPWMRVMDVGCGTGDTLAGLKAGTKLGIDFSFDMIAAAKARHVDAYFEVRNLLDEADTLRDLGSFDLIYTQRCLINLKPSEQLAAIQKLARLLRRNGSLLLVEHSLVGLARLNRRRAAWGLPRIQPPWHNHYLSDWDVRELPVPYCSLVDDAVDYSSTYYVLSRIVNGKWAQLRKREPQYDAWINRVALELPSIGRCGQARYWRWVKP